MFRQRGAKKEVRFKKFFGVAKKSQLTFITKEADSFVNASNRAFTTKPLGIISSVAKCFFRKTCCKRVAKVLQKRISKNAQSRKPLILLGFSAHLSQGGDE